MKLKWLLVKHIKVSAGFFFFAAIRSIGMMAALWRKPVVTWTPIKADWDSYPTLIATLGTYENIAQNIATLLRCQDWRTIGTVLSVYVSIKCPLYTNRQCYLFNFRNPLYLSLQLSWTFSRVFSDIGHTNDSFDKAVCNLIEAGWRTLGKLCRVLPGWTHSKCRIRKPFISNLW